jgi:hypothetical protein
MIQNWLKTFLFLKTSEKRTFLTFGFPQTFRGELRFLIIIQQGITKPLRKVFFPIGCVMTKYSVPVTRSQSEFFQYQIGDKPALSRLPLIFGFAIATVAGGPKLSFFQNPRCITRKSLQIRNSTITQAKMLAYLASEILICGSCFARFLCRYQGCT